MYAIVIDRLSYRFPDGTLALDDISLRIEAGEKVALVGPNGSGKSTLLLHLNGVLRATGGSIQIDGMPLEAGHVGQIRARVGLTFQNPDDQLFSLRVSDDVAFGPMHMGLAPDEVQVRVERALAQTGMDAYAARFSHNLSTGEKKRIALATVLSMDASILALDEPSAGLDPRGRRNLMTLLRTFTDQTLLIATHDMSLAGDLCDRVVVLDGGHVVADGPSGTLLNDAELMLQHGLA